MRSLDGLWANERGSQLQLVCDGDLVSGVYRTNVGRPDFATEFRVVGQRNGNLVGFVVAWQPVSSLTAWSGRYEPDRDEIVTLWHLVSDKTDVKDETGATVTKVVPLWEAFRTQQSVFRRVER